MEPNNQFNPSVSAQNPVSAPIESKKKVGPIVVILAVVLILIIGALYLFASGMNKDTTPNDEAPVETVKPVTSNSDDVNSIDADLNASINGIDQQNF